MSRKTERQRTLRLIAAEKMTAALRAEVERGNAERARLVSDLAASRVTTDSYRTMLAGLVREHSHINVYDEPPSYKLGLTITPDMARGMRFAPRGGGTGLADIIGWLIEREMQKHPSYGSFLREAHKW